MGTATEIECEGKREAPVCGFAATALIAAVLLPTLYVLSVGPVVFLYKHRWLGDRPFEFIVSCYAPLNYLANHFRPFGLFFFWYVELWR